MKITIETKDEAFHLFVVHLVGSYPIEVNDKSTQVTLEETGLATIRDVEAIARVMGGPDRITCQN